MTSPIVVDGTAIKTPHRFSIQRYNLTKAGRTANGMMVMDLIAKKRTFQMGYDVLTGKEFEKILTLVDVTKVFFQLQYQENGVTKTATVYAGAIPSDLHRREPTGTGQWIWKNIDFQFIER